MAPTLLYDPDQDIDQLDFWQLRGLYARLVLSGPATPGEQRQLADVTRKLDKLYGPDWRSGREPTFH
ncbi:hypothetical protein [Aliiruegeria sabulilitoris]|uniref:hypothetical protein n=1 Tax=Aliiruegeria sabulilitoris TaxID=1510458 RepID=UPI000834AE97|nr:hypothetical protein [Aliiruegeria sabulilitoris]NDR58633.1 hypothetical protein [Pseudoruegeria sp. M32A2M]